MCLEAIRIAGSGFHQTVGGASIPISCALNVLITGKTYSPGQLAGISIVIAGLSVKLKVLLDGDAPFHVDAAALGVLVSCVGHAIRASAWSTSRTSNRTRPPAIE